MTPTAGHHRGRTPQGFTIVELLVVIVIIAILATITILAYSGITKSAAASSLQSDLSNASTKLKTFVVETGAYPGSISDCPSPVSTNLCLKPSGGNYFIGYSANNQAAPKTFLLIASNSQTANPNKLVYKITDGTKPTQLASTMQPGVTPGAVLELHAAKANGGTSQGINDPLTTTWANTSGSGGNGALVNFGGQTPWQGTGTPEDPFYLGFDGSDDVVSLSAFVAQNANLGAAFTEEAWARQPDDVAGNHYIFGGGTRIMSRTAGVYAEASGTGAMQPGTPSNIGVWVHWVFSIDGAHAELRRNTTLLNSRDTATPPFSTPTALSTVSYGRIQIALARVYPFALSADQVAANYAAGPTW